MKILKISGKNLASLAGSFEVDFQQEPLCSSGLFAISGPTGAGKSTLLDALCLALYDDTPRLARAGGKGIGLPDVRDETVTPHDSRTLLRRGAAEGFAEVDFVGNDGHAYRARWSVRRSRGKPDGALQAVAMSLQQLPELRPIGGTNREVKFETERRIGLSFEQFTRAVLLAQNEFSAFLKADDGERGELLETLTGTAIYSEISKRAHERMKAEQLALQQLDLRLADLMPLESEARAVLEQDSAQAAARLAELQQRKSLLESHLRWHQADQEFCSRVESAVQALGACTADHEAAAGRRAHLAGVEAVQSARPLLAARERAENDRTQEQQRVVTAQAAHDTACAALRDTEAAVTRASAAVLDAEQAKDTATPMLDAAKALDAQLATLRPAHAQAEQDLQAARMIEQSASQQLADNAAQRDAARQERDESANWLERHARQQALADGWQRWDTLLKQAGQDAHAQAQAARACERAKENEALSQKRAAESAMAMAATEKALREAEQRLGQASDRLAAIADAELPARRTQAEARRDLLSEGKQLWQELAGALAAQAQHADKLQQCRQDIERSESLLEHINGRLPAAAAALEQAERSLKGAEAACSDSVEDLRATLEPQAPCPVCGSQEHPYASANPQLHAMLARLQLEVDECRARTRQLQQEQAAQAALGTESRRQEAELARQSQALAQSLDDASNRWRVHAIAAELQPSPADTDAAWFAAQQEAVRAQLAEIARAEDAVRRASQERDAARGELDAATAQHAKRKDEAAGADAALARCVAERTAEAGKHADIGARIDVALTTLDAAFGGRDWRDAWRSGPDSFHAACRRDAEQWHAYCARRDDAQVRLGKLDVAHEALEKALAQARDALQRATQALAASTAIVGEKQAARRALFDGRDVEQVQAGLKMAIDSARAALAAQAQARQHSADDEVRLREALQQAHDRLAARKAEAVEAEAAIVEWLARFNRGKDAQMDVERLRTLLAHPADWIDAERKALQAIDAALHGAGIVLQERRAQRQAHAATRPESSATESAETVREQLDATIAEHQLAADGLAALRLRLAEDDTRRERSAAMSATIERQRAVARTWSQLSDLIGSHDGKKFRNYAQQFTLDVLLGYANRHLAELAKRYRLERIGETLALLVVDQDMGDEMRSVHSLSGGESFLVSLSLALALASLSSNRVRVESLFIDEGFGSLDAETLSVAMDALDGLQAMGRKVGVISHVQEMTERIATRIQVRREAGGRSAISVLG